MVDFNNELYLKKRDNIKISCYCCVNIMNLIFYEFNFYRKQKEENIEYEELKKLVLCEI